MHHKYLKYEKRVTSSQLNGETQNTKKEKVCGRFIMTRLQHLKEQ